MNIEKVVEHVKRIYGLTIDLSATLNAFQDAEEQVQRDLLVPVAMFLLNELEQRMDLLAEEFGGWVAIGVVAARPANDAGAVDG